jgi:hypothetical protein
LNMCLLVFTIQVTGDAGETNIILAPGLENRAGFKRQTACLSLLLLQGSSGAGVSPQKALGVTSWIRYAQALLSRSRAL